MMFGPQKGVHSPTSAPHLSEISVTDRPHSQLHGRLFAAHCRLPNRAKYHVDGRDPSTEWSLRGARRTVPVTGARRRQATRDARGTDQVRGSSFFPLHLILENTPHAAH